LPHARTHTADARHTFAATEPETDRIESGAPELTWALLDALTHKHIAGAALDVYAEEPLPADHPFRSLDNVLATPHIGYITQQTYRQSNGSMAK